MRDASNEDEFLRGELTGTTGTDGRQQVEEMRRAMPNVNPDVMRASQEQVRTRRGEGGGKPHTNRLSKKKKGEGEDSDANAADASQAASFHDARRQALGTSLANVDCTLKEKRRFASDRSMQDVSDPNRSYCSTDEEHDPGTVGESHGTNAFHVDRRHDQPDEASQRSRGVRTNERQGSVRTQRLQATERGRQRAPQVRKLSGGCGKICPGQKQSVDARHRRCEICEESLHFESGIMLPESRAV
eukprot:scaffold316_cov352-Pavlova_lutheri.AAC.51